LIVLHSHHHDNTRKVAEAIAGVLQADILAPPQATPDMLDRYTLVGFGSGIYFGRIAAELRRWIRQLPTSSTRRPAFVFSTSGLSCLTAIWHREPKRLLRQRGFEIVGEFGCRGFDTVGPLWLIGGLNRRHPDAADLARAEQFARTLRG
jgi:flavodoxin